MCILWPGAGIASASDLKVIVVDNTTGAYASDLHVSFDGADGNLYVDPLSVVSISCPTPSVPSNGTVTNTAVIDWGTACVAPGASILFLARTTNGPLIVTNSYWTFGGANIGLAKLHPGFPKPIKPPPPPIGPGAFMIEWWCAPNAPGFYVNCQKLPLGPCWIWWCCLPAGTYWWRVVWCPFAFPGQRFFGIGPWIPITGWLPDGGFPQSYWWVINTIGVPPQLPPPFNPQPTNGPPPFSPQRGSNAPPYRPHRYQTALRYTEDGATTFRQGSDFVQSFFDVFADISVIRPDTNDFSATWNGKLDELAPRYAKAAAVFGPLATELGYVATNPPSAAASNLVADCQLLQLSLTSISGQFSNHNIVDPTPYNMAAQAFFDMRKQFTNLAVTLPLVRLYDAANSVNSIGNAYSYAAQVVASGMVNSNPAEQDNLILALHNRALSEFHLAATAMMPHMRVYPTLPYTSTSWNKSTIGQVRVKIQDQNTREVLEDFFVPMSDGGYFDVPFLQTTGLPVNLYFKLPTSLSYVRSTTLQDGFPLTLPLVFGDVNGDNVIDSQDVILVQSSLGSGGSNAVAVTAADLNGDGYVNQADLNVFPSNLPQFGQELPAPLTTFNYDGSFFDVFFPLDFQLESTSQVSDQNSSFTPVPMQPSPTGPGYHLALPPTNSLQFFRASQVLH